MRARTTALGMHCPWSPAVVYDQNIALTTNATTITAKAAVASPYSEGEIQAVSDCGGTSPLPARLSSEAL